MSPAWRARAVWSAGAAALAALVSVYVAPVFGSGVLVTGDHPFHLAVAESAARTLGAHRLVAWIPGMFAGYPLFSPLVPAPLGYAAAALLGGVLGLTVAYKLMVAVSIVLPVLGLWTLLHRRVSAPAAFAGANLLLLTSYALVQPLEGLWASYLGLGLMIFGVLAVDPARRSGWPALAGGALAFAAAGLTDPVTWVAGVVLAPVLLVATARALGRAATLRLAAALAVAGVTVGGWLVLVIARQSAWGLPPAAPGGDFTGLLARLPVWFVVPGEARTLRDEVLPALRDGATREALGLGAHVALAHVAEVALLAAAAAGLVRLGRRSAPSLAREAAVTGAVMLALVLVPWPWLAAAGGLPGLAAFAPERFVPYVNVALAALAACALDGVALSRPRVRVAAATLGILALAGLHTARYATYAEHLALKTASTSVIHAELADVWAWVRGHADPARSRVLYQELDAVAFLDGGTTNLAALSARETGVASVSTQPVRQHVALRRPGAPAAERPLGSVASIQAYMTRLNCDLLVLWHPGLRHLLVTTGAAEVVHESGQRLFTVLRRTGWEPRWVEFDHAVDALETAALADERLEFRLRNPYAGNGAVLKVGYHPGWTARVNGQTRAISARDSLMRVGDLPPGPVVLEFVFDSRAL